MNYTREELLYISELLVGVANGRTLQGRAGDRWYDWDPTRIPAFDCKPIKDNCRLKPEPKSVPWDSPEDVPMPVCWVREREDEVCGLIVHMDRDGVDVGNDTYYRFSSLTDLEHSTDGKTWKPCTKEIQQ